MQEVDRLSGTGNRKDRITSGKQTFKGIQPKTLQLKPIFELEMARLHSGAASERTDTRNAIFTPIPVVVWQQPAKTNSINIQNETDTETHKNTHMPQIIQSNDIEPQKITSKGSLTSRIGT